MSYSSQRIGEFLVSIGAMTDEQVQSVVEQQKQDHEKLFGEIAIEMGFINDAAVDRYLANAKKNEELEGSALQA